MISSWLDLVIAVVLVAAGLYHLERGEARRRRAQRRWLGDPAALLAAVVGATVLATGLVLLLYSSAFAIVSEGILSR